MKWTFFPTAKTNIQAGKDLRKSLQPPAQSRIICEFISDFSRLYFSQVLTLQIHFQSIFSKDSSYHASHHFETQPLNVATPKITFSHTEILNPSTETTYWPVHQAFIIIYQLPPFFFFSPFPACYFLKQPRNIWEPSIATSFNLTTVQFAHM